MRLAVVTPFLDRQHGTESCLIEQIERLAWRDHWEVHVFSQRVEQVAGVSYATPSSPGCQACIVWHKISDIPGPHLFRYLWWFFANQFKRWLEQRFSGLHYDLIYSPGVNCLDADVIVVHIVFHEFYARVKPQLVLRRFALWHWPRLIHRKVYYKLAMGLEKKAYSDPRVRLIAVSGLVAAQLKRHFQRTDVAIIHNAVDTLRFSQEARVKRREESRRAFRFSHEEFVLLLIGNDWKKKGLDTMLHALTSLRDLPLRLLVVGSDDPALYEPMLKQLKLLDRVTFNKPRLDVLAFYASADSYVGPSLEDAFNLPILEAMACGLPTIASVQAGASENVQDYETGLLLRDPENSFHLGELVRRLFDDVSFRQKIGNAASSYVREHCSWNQNASQTREFLETTLHSLQNDSMLQPDSNS